ncbi:MAG: hypothetical protein WBC82_12115 [Dehalococcoidia bacterium]
MKIIPVLIIILVAAIAVIVAIGVTGGFEPGSTPTSTAEPTPTPAATPTSLPIVVMSCDQAKNAIQEALDAYNAEQGEWPTADGQPGDIEWTELVPDFMEAVPANDSKCHWQVNSDPEGEVCVQHTC